MDFILITVGLLFFLNPMIIILDILPDFIGCILILLGLNRLKSVSPELEDAAPYFKYMMIASVARSILLFASAGFDDTIKLSITLIFAVIEFGISIPALTSLYNGLAYLNVRFDGKTKETPEFRYIGAVFFGARGFLSILPQLGAIANNGFVTSGDTDSFVAYSGLLNLANIVLTLIFAAFWLFSILTYIGKMAKDSDFCKKISEEYLFKKTQSPHVFIRKSLIFAFSCFVFGSFFLIDFIGDGKNYLPDFIFAVSSLLGLAVLSKNTTVKKSAYVSGGAYFALSLADFIYYNIFMEKRFFARFSMVIERFLWEYLLAIGLSLLSACALVVYLYHIFTVLKRVSRSHTTKELPDDFTKSKELNLKFILKTERFLKAFTVLGIISGASSVAFTALVLLAPAYWMANLVINIAVFCVSSVLFTRLSEGVKIKYELETDE